MNIEQLTGEDIVATELPRKFNGNFANVKQEVESHINNKNNPHKVTAEQLGLASAYIYQGDVETFQNLPTQGVQKGWVYNVKAEFTLNGAQYPAGTDVAWDGTKWNTLGGSLKGYVRKVNNVTPDSNANVNIKNLIATQLVNGQDLNNIKTEGRYQCDTDSVAATLLNSPLKTAFYLDVYVNSSTQVKQVITSSNVTPQVYIRTLVNNTWGSWRTVQFTTTVYNMTEIQNTAQKPIRLTGSFSHKYHEIAGGNIDLRANVDVYWVTPATSDVGVTINLSNLIKQEGYSRFITLYVDGSKCPNLRTITYTNKPSGFTLMNEPEKMMGGMVNVIGIEIVGTGNIYTITNNGGSSGGNGLDESLFVKKQNTENLTIERLSTYKPQIQLTEDTVYVKINDETQFETEGNFVRIGDIFSEVVNNEIRFDGSVLYRVLELPVLDPTRKADILIDRDARDVIDPGVLFGYVNSASVCKICVLLIMDRLDRTITWQGCTLCIDAPIKKSDKGLMVVFFCNTEETNHWLLISATEVPFND